MVKEFVYTISLRRNHPESIAREAGGKIFTFGSYRLGVHGSGKYSLFGALVPRVPYRYLCLA